MSTRNGTYKCEIAQHGLIYRRTVSVMEYMYTRDICMYAKRF